jgi:hypothetical protein
MSRRLVAALLFAVLGCAPAVAAQERVEANEAPVPSVRVLQIGSGVRLAELDRQAFPVPPAPRPRGSALLNSMYASSALLHALDVHSTMLALDRGGIEANPLMAGITKNKAAFIATKAAVATGTILAARNLSRRNKVAAVLTLAAINTAYAMIVQHNYKVARQLK